MKYDKNMPLFGIKGEESMDELKHSPWEEYTGYRDKCLHDIKLHNGTIHRLLWPNANSWHGAGQFKDSEVAFIRESVDHVMDYSPRELAEMRGYKYVEEIIHTPFRPPCVLEKNGTWRMVFSGMEIPKRRGYDHSAFSRRRA